MNFRVCVLAFVVFDFGAAQVPSRLDRAIHALARALQYLEDHISEVNVDAFLCTRMMGGQLEAMLNYEPKVFQRTYVQLKALQDQANLITDKGLRFVEKSQPKYISIIGSLAKKPYKLMWYPSRSITRSLIQEPVPCPISDLNETFSDLCFNELGEPRKDYSDSCNPSSKCLQFNTRANQRGYTLTHQVYYWQIIEQWKCVREVPQILRDTLCSNVMRDAEITERLKFTQMHADLFMEQIGLCGFWGYKDFNKPEWLQKILEWQKFSGCYASKLGYACIDEPVEFNHNGVRREEKHLSDGCLSHKTGVALLALVANIRFEAEKEYLRMHRRESFLPAA